MTTLQVEEPLRKRSNLDIQVLRGIAIALVIMQHARGRLPTPGWYQAIFNHAAFWGGVDVFFAISGFLIYATFRRDMARESHPAKAFWVRRVYRLLPAATSWIAVSVIVAALATHTPFADPGKAALSGLAALAGVSNLYWSLCTPNYALCGSADFNSVTWSLSLEWQLYALATFAMLLLRPRGAIVLMLALATVLSLFDAPSWSLPWAFRMQAFALGALVAHGREAGWRLLALDHMPRFAAVALLVGGIAMVAWAPAHIPQPWTLPAIALGALACLLSTLRGDSYSPWLAPLTWLGERSYSVYLCHLPLLLLAREAAVRGGFSEPTMLHATMVAALTLVAIGLAGDASYRLIELPWQRRARRRASTAAEHPQLGAREVHKHAREGSGGHGQ